MRSFRPLTCCVIAVIASVSGASFGQMQVGSGHALDANLELGSGGYNGNVNRGGPVSYGNITSRYGAYNQFRPTTNRAAQYSPYAGGYGQNWQNDRITNEDVFLNDRAYSAGWQRTTGGYSSYSGPPRGASSSSGGGSGGGSVGAYKIQGRVGG